MNAHSCPPTITRPPTGTSLVVASSSSSHSLSKRYFRPPRDSLHSAFRPIPSLGLPRNENRHYAMASSLLERIQRRPGVLGGCVLHRQRAMYSQLSPDVTAYALALLQPTQSSSYTDEDNRRIQRRGLKIREMMLRGKNRLIRSREYVSLAVH